MLIPIIYATIFILAIYIAVVGRGYIMALALIVGGIAFLALQRYIYLKYAEMVAKSEMDSDPEDDDDDLRLPPA
jgi:hypothetical protein